MRTLNLQLDVRGIIPSGHLLVIFSRKRNDAIFAGIVCLTGGILVNVPDQNSDISSSNPTAADLFSWTFSWCE